MPTWHKKTTLNGAYMPIYIANIDRSKKVIEALAKNGIDSRRYFTPSLDVAYKKQKSFGCANSQKLSGGVICLPLHNFMSIDDVLEVTKNLKGAL
jgi:dTDP-4-amino-4,6-dideoxygalactose transaminase